MNLITLFIVLLASFSLLEDPENCQLLAEENGIQVFKCKRDDSGLNAIRASFELEATAAQYASVVLDINEYPNWNFEVSNPRIITKINESELIYYIESKAPWPVKDRYVVLHLRVIQDPVSKMMQIALQDVPQEMPRKKGFIRMAEYVSTLEIIPVSPGKLSVSYFLEIDPGGKIPKWAVNKLSAKIPVKSFTNLKKRLEFLFEQQRANE